MAIDKLNAHLNSGYVQDYSNIRVPKTQGDATSLPVEAPVKEQKEADLQQNATPSPDVPVKRKDTPIEEMNIGFNAKDTSLIGFGGNFNIATTDMRDAISTMQKDQVLHQYQYFVGNNQAVNRTEAGANAVDNIVYSGEEGIVYRK